MKSLIVPLLKQAVMLGAPIQAENEPRLLFLPSPGSENSPNGVENGPLSALASITPKRQIRQPTGQAPQPSSTKKEAISTIGLPNHCARPASHPISHCHGMLRIAQKLGIFVRPPDALHDKTTR
jgi:hypothetical protein